MVFWKVVAGDGFLRAGLQAEEVRGGDAAFGGVVFGEGFGLGVSRVVNDSSSRPIVERGSNLGPQGAGSG